MRILAVVFALVCGVLGLTRAAEAAVTVNIDLSSQRMVVTNGSGETQAWAISSGRSGFSTPRGFYRPQRLVRMHYSRKYHMSPMPHSIFFRGGYAIHGTGATGALGRPASHGCIRLAPGNAAKLFAMVKAEGARIQITGTPPGSTRFAKSKPAKSKYYARSGKTKHHYAARTTNTRALGYAPVRNTPSMKVWSRNPARLY